MNQEQLKELLHYCPETGVFTRRKNFGRHKAGVIVGTKPNRTCKYVTIYAGGKRYVAQRLAWLYVHGQWPDDDLDHINRIKTDNRFCNLRAATPSENAQNHPKLTRGVSWNKREKKWGAYLRIRGKQLHLGWHKTYESALAARKQAEVTHFPFRS